MCWWRVWNDLRTVLHATHAASVDYLMLTKCVRASFEHHF
jgi:hypothetical protein